MHLAALTSLITLLFLEVQADVAPFYSNSIYNNGGYGEYVAQSFKSNPQITSAPILNFMRPFSNCDDGSYLFISPRGNKPDPTPMMLDVTGSLVWAAEQHYGEVYNLQVQRYKDEEFLTFWFGNDAIGGHGIGEYLMLDQHYNERHRIKAANDLGGDLHEFTITPENTAIITIYQQIVVDTSSVAGEGRRGWIWDAIFQELDIETGEAKFEWHASIHIPIANSYTTPGDDTWDVYHINSIEKDEEGNYLISFRFLRAIVYVDGKTGEVLWQLGGKANSFTDLSDGKATTFMGQHDARWHAGQKYITFFDNRADWYNRMDDQSQGTRIEMDLEKMTARLDQTFTTPFKNVLSSSQGSYQTLPNGHVVLGYGFNGVIAEFSSDGQLLCEAYMQPSSTFDTGDVQSYRNLRFNWTGFPNSTPNLVLDQKTLYMSWNGATEIANWLMLSSDSYDEDYEQSTPEYHNDPKRSVNDAIIIAKAGFETEFQIFSDDYGLRRYIRVLALDKDGRPLGTSDVVDIGDLATVSGAAHYDSTFAEGAYDEGHEGDYTYLEDDIEDLRLLIIFGCCAILSALLIVALALGRHRIAELWSTTKSKSNSVGEKAAALVENKSTLDFGAFMQRVRNVFKRRRRRDSFEEFAAKEGLLTQDDPEAYPVPEVQFRGLLQGMTGSADGTERQHS